jgi:drug/metabolite transporter (DMT)-like permease
LATSWSARTGSSPCDRALRETLVRLQAPAAAATTGVLVGAAVVATRAISDEAGPAAIALLRYLVGGAILLPIALVSRRMKIARQDALPVVLLGIGQFGVLVVLLNTSVQHIPAARAALLFATMPVMTMVIGRLTGREALAAWQAIGILLTVVGVAAVIAAEPPPLAAGPMSWLGDLAALGSAATGATCSLLYRPYLERNSALGIGALAMVASVPPLAVLAWTEGFFGGSPSFSATGWLAVTFIGVSSAIGYALWLKALATASATNVTAFLALGPSTAAALGAVLLGEPITQGFAAGTALVAAGLTIAHRAGTRGQTSIGTP